MPTPISSRTQPQIIFIAVTWLFLAIYMIFRYRAILFLGDPRNNFAAWRFPWSSRMFPLRNITMTSLPCRMDNWDDKDKKWEIKENITWLNFKQEKWKQKRPEDDRYNNIMLSGGSSSQTVAITCQCIINQILTLIITYPYQRLQETERMI